jgi:hypothetical protein
MFAVLFPLLSCVAIWIYTLVFGFASLWFSHYCLAALAQMRIEQRDSTVLTPKTSENRFNTTANTAINNGAPQADNILTVERLN